MHHRDFIVAGSPGNSAGFHLLTMVDGRILCKDPASASCLSTSSDSSGSSGFTAPEAATFVHSSPSEILHFGHSSAVISHSLTSSELLLANIDQLIFSLLTPGFSLNSENPVQNLLGPSSASSFLQLSFFCSTDPSGIFFHHKNDDCRYLLKIGHPLFSCGTKRLFLGTRWILLIECVSSWYTHESLPSAASSGSSPSSIVHRSPPYGRNLIFSIFNLVGSYAALGFPSRFSLCTAERVAMSSSVSSMGTSERSCLVVVEELEDVEELPDSCLGSLRSPSSMPSSSSSSAGFPSSILLLCLGGSSSFSSSTNSSSSSPGTSHPEMSLNPLLLPLLANSCWSSLNSSFKSP